MMTANEFVNKAKEYASKYKTTYVWGTFGWPTTNTLVQRALKAYSTNSKYESKLNSLVSKGYIMSDCVGMIKSILWGFTGDTSKIYCGAAYASNNVPDINADTMIAKCKDVSTDFENIIAGEVVWMSGHIGIYIGDGKVVECTPSWNDGVQITALGNIKSTTATHSRVWTKHGKLPYVDYTGESVAIENANKISKTAYNSGYIYHIPFDDIAYIGYIPSVNLSARKGELVTNAYSRLRYNGRKADFIFNAELFGSDMSAASAITDEGVIHYEREYWGIGFVDHQKPVWSYKNNAKAIDFVGAYPALLRDGRTGFDSVPSGLSGSRARTAIGIKDNTLGIALIPESPGATLAALATKFRQLGYIDVANLDGGGSTQCVAPGGNITSTRPVRGFVAIWLKSSANSTGGTLTSVQNLTASTSYSTMKQDKSAAKGKALYVNVNSKLNVRSEATTSATIIKQLARNSKVYWYGNYKTNGSATWKYIQYYPYTSESVGYVNDMYLSETKV